MVDITFLPIIAVLLFHHQPPHWPSGKAFALRAEDSGFNSRLRRDFFRGRVIPGTQKLALQWLPCQAPGVLVSALGLVGLVSVYCDMVREKVWSATSVSVWQHVKSSEQIRPWDTLACYWDVKQPKNNLSPPWWSKCDTQYLKSLPTYHSPWGNRTSWLGVKH